MKKQLIIVSDMEGASGIFDYNRDALRHEELYPKNKLWREYGRKCMTSDVLAVCNAANDFGIDEIYYYDSHFAGCTESNVELERLPANVKLFDTPERRFFWRRIRGQAQFVPYGIITVGQHARYGEKNAYFAHTIQSPPIKAVWINGKHIAEIGQAVMSFWDTPYIANIGCAASHKEARELSENVTCITVKDKAKGYEPSYKDTYSLIYQGVLDALNDYENKTAYKYEHYCKCSMELCNGYHFSVPENVGWKGSFEDKIAYWEAPSIEIALELFNYVRECIEKDDIPTV